MHVSDFAVAAPVAWFRKFVQDGYAGCDGSCAACEGLAEEAWAWFIVSAVESCADLAGFAYSSDVD